MLSEQGVTWILGKLEIDVESYPEYCDTVCITSWSRGASGFRMLRDFELKANGHRVGGGSSVWFFFDRRAGKVTRVPEAIDQAYGADRSLALAQGIESWTPYERFNPEIVRSYASGIFDLDAGGHVNNVRYIDYVMDAARDHISGSLVKSIRIQFSRAIASNVNFDIGIRREGTCVFFRLNGSTGMFARGEINLDYMNAS
jgi:acyl-ACP thioesterase